MSDHIHIMASPIKLFLPLLALPVVGLVSGIFVCIYNIFFHPLRKYPGPLLGRATRLWNIYHEIKGDGHLVMKEMHDKYGEVVRMAPNELSYNSGRGWQDVCGHRNASKSGVFEKDTSFYGVPVNGSKSILLATDEDHRRMRKLVSHAFSEKSLAGQEGIITHYVDLLISELSKRCESGPENGVVNMVHWYNFTTFDIIGDLAFGTPFFCLRDGVMKPFVKHIFSVVQYSVYHRACRRFPSPIKEFLTSLIPKDLGAGRAEQFQWSFAQARKRMGEGTDREDFMSYILKANNEKGMSPTEIESNTQLLVTAGSETTATLLSGATFHLLSNPRVLNELVAEIQKSFTSEDQITMKSTQPLPFLHAVLEESLRMFPPVPNAFPRTTPEPGATICGQFVPAGTSVSVQQWAAYRSAKNFTEPDSFIPERWLGDKRFENDDKACFNPFSHGPRNCLGKNLAYSELRLILARVLWNFTLELQPESYLWDSKMKTLLLWEKPDLMVKLTKRVPALV